jgi:hypothetical protein
MDADYFEFKLDGDTNVAFGEMGSLHLRREFRLAPTLSAQAALDQAWKGTWFLAGLRVTEEDQIEEETFAARHARISNLMMTYSLAGWDGEAVRTLNGGEGISNWKFRLENNSPRD